MKKIGSLGFALAFVLAGCGSTPEIALDDGSVLAEGQTIYTLTNLHPDPNQFRLYSINYQLAGFIPRCTEIEVVGVRSDSIAFSADGNTYTYIYHKASGDFGANLKKYFGSSCDNAIVSGLSAVDKEGIEEGRVKIGMSKQGVQLAIGYPPQHQTPSLDSNSWRYWNNRFNTFIVEFDQAGIVTEIIN